MFKYIVGFILGVTTLICVIWFVKLGFNPILWSEADRVFFSIMFFAFGGFGVVLAM